MSLRLCKRDCEEGRGNKDLMQENVLRAECRAETDLVLRKPAETLRTERVRERDVHG